MLTFSFSSQHSKVKNLPKGLPSVQIGSTYQKKKVIIITVIITIKAKNSNKIMITIDNSNNNISSNGSNNISSNGSDNNKIIILKINVIVIIIM